MLTCNPSFANYSGFFQIRMLDYLQQRGVFFTIISICIGSQGGLIRGERFPVNTGYSFHIWLNLFAPEGFRLIEPRSDKELKVSYQSPKIPTRAPA